MQEQLYHDVSSKPGFIFFAELGEPKLEGEKIDQPKKKTNIVMLHSFSTNSAILEGLYNALTDHEEINLIPVDLPGFHENEKPLDQKTFVELSKAFTEKLKELVGEDPYWIAGISFGFRIANDAEKVKRFQGMIALEPFEGYESLRMSPGKKKVFEVLGTVVDKLRAYRVMFNRFMIKNLFMKGQNDETVELTAKHIDPETFVKIGNELLHTSDATSDLTKHPQILIINSEDKTLNADRLIKRFNDKRVNLLAEIRTSIQHYPEDLSEEYWRKAIEKDRLTEKLIKTIKKYEKNSPKKTSK